MRVRPYRESDFERLCELHDASRPLELAASGLSDAFVPMAQAAGPEGLFDATILVAEDDAGVHGFVAWTDEELTWLYVDPRRHRRGIARALVRAALSQAGAPLALDVLVGNEAALALYRAEGFELQRTVSGRLAGNERFAASAHVLRHPGGGSTAQPSIAPTEEA